MLSAAIGVAVGALGVLVLLGWALHISTLQTILPGLVSMKPNTALTLVFAGACIGILATRPIPNHRRVARLLAVAVLVVGALTVAEYVIGRDFGIDNLLFADKFSATQTSSAGRMSQATAGTFVALGAVFLVIDDGPSGALSAQILSVGVAMVTGVALAGYLYGVAALYQIGFFTSMALHTAVATGALAIGALALRPKDGLVAELTAATAGGMMARRLLPIAIGLPLVLGWFRLIGQQLGYYGTEFGLALLVTSMIALFSVGIWLTARRLNREDRARQQALEALTVEVAERRRTETFLERVMDSASNSILVLDPGGRVSLVNRSTAELFQSAPDELVGVDFTSFLPEDGGESGRELLASALAGGSGVIADVLIVRPNASQTTIRASYGPILEDGGVAGSVVLAEDVSERKSLEAQLRQAQKMEAVGELAGGIAHDFNNMLTVIRGYADVTLASLPFDDVNRMPVTEIRQASDRAASLTAQLLAFSRRQILRPEPVKLNALVESVEPLIRQILPKDITIKLNLASDETVVEIDRGQFEQVLLNLAINARDAMLTGGVITIETATVDLDVAYVAARPAVVPGRYGMLAVIDTGVGMDAATQTHIFEPFFTTKEVGKGTGLGLAMVYGTVKQSGGSVWVYSELGLGTTVKIYLPIATGLQVSARASKPVERQLTLPPLSLLVVEDEAQLSRFIAEALERAGCSVIVAANASEALEAIEGSQHLDLVISDVIMPGTNGLELVRLLRERRPTLRALFMSGYATRLVESRGVDLEAERFLQKPFTLDQLISAIQETVGPSAEP
jgi:two-component system, cell cycle sensor histidine kinase and response regulator CckA